jgi:hypothetical protein
VVDGRSNEFVVVHEAFASEVKTFDNIFPLVIKAKCTKFSLIFLKLNSSDLAISIFIDLSESSFEDLEIILVSCETNQQGCDTFCELCSS